MLADTQSYLPLQLQRELEMFIKMHADKMSKQKQTKKQKRNRAGGSEKSFSRFYSSFSRIN